MSEPFPDAPRAHPAGVLRDGGGFRTFEAAALHQSISERFASQVALYPERVAVSGGRERLTYRELDARADRAAAGLLARGVTPGDRVALALDHEPAAVSAVLGALKAGAVVTPLDPAWPESRSTAIVDDAAPRLVLTGAAHRTLADRLAGPDRPALELEALAATATAAATWPAVSADALAFLLYTSGSTGPPKGVMRTHAAQLRSARGDVNGFRVGCEDRVTLFASLAVGHAMSVMALTLLSGATLCLWDPRQQGLAGVAAWLAEEAVTIYWSAASIFRVVAPSIASPLPAMRAVRVASEQVRGQDVALFRRHFAPPCVFASGLSSTETTNFTQYFLDPDVAVPEGGVVPVGYPVDDMDVLILGDGDEQLAPGERGEIAVRSRYLSPGYWRRPAETAEAFRPAEDGGRVFRTGDLGRKRADGCVEHLGRTGFRVKVRGARVELEEVEAALVRHPAVRAAAAVVEPDGARIVAYLVPDGTPPTAAELRVHLRSTLAEAALPSAFVVMDALPLTSNGKVDRGALAANVRPPVAPSPDEPPAGAIEAALAEIWSEVLGIAPPDADASFEDLGGHSLGAMRVIVRVREVFGLELSFRDFLDRPTIAAMAAALAAKSAGAPAAGLGPLTPGHVPVLSFAQERLWFLDQADPGGAAYNNVHCFRVRGRLDAEALGRSLSEIVRRHAVLRTRVVSLDGDPALAVGPARPVPLERLDVSATPGGDAEAAARRLAVEIGRRPFVLARDILLRAALVRLDADDHLLILANHHIASDRWSQWVLGRELSALYGAMVADRPSPLPELPVQYADFAAWQRQWLTGDRLAGLLAYWRERLDGVAPLALPTDRPRTASRGSRGATETRTLPGALADRLRALARHEGVTLFMTLLAGFQTLLHRWSGQPDVAVGTPVAGRPVRQSEGLIGFFVNTLVLRSDFSGDPSFRALLAQVREAALGAYAHQDLPFEKLVEELHPQRDPGRTPLFQAMFALQNAPSAPLELPGLAVSPVEVDLEAAKFDLTLAMFDDREGLRARLEYSVDLFEAPTAARMLRHLETLLDAAAATPDAPVSRLALSTAEEVRALLAWNATTSAVPPGAGVHRLVEAWADRDPDASAVTDGRESLGYGELDRRANRLARRLRALGAGRDSHVAVCLERSVAMVVAWLAVLKAGGAYVPLDPTLPAERRRFLLADTTPDVVITEARHRAVFDRSGASLLCLDADREAIAAADDGRLAAGAEGEETACILYTSGSTGRPKGVLIPHRAIAALVADPEYVTLGTDDVVAQAVNASFDAASFEVWGALAHGARLAVIGADALLAPALLGAALRRHAVTALFLPTAVFHVVAREAPEALATVTTLLVGGETLDVSSVGQAREGGCAARIVNVYGPTETTTFATWHAVEGGEPDGRPLPIGRALAHARVHVLDSHLVPAPVGVPGELCIGGAGVATGYLGEPGLTAERFIPDPFGATSGARLYRTGDRGRWRPDGTLEFLGRLDDQVKVRGQRIEPGEVAATIRRHPAVADAAVVARPAAAGGVELVGYFVPERDTVLDAATLRTFLRPWLPDSMIPAALVELSALPLTAHGKLDRRALPEPVPSRHGTDFVAPRTPLEREIASIWEAVLGIARVGVHDDFFVLAGHSLAAMRVVARLTHRFGVDVPVWALFEVPTVAGLAETVGRLIAAR